MIPALVANRGEANFKASAGTTLALTTNGTIAAGNLIVACVLFDNFTTASKPVVSSITRMSGETNTWVSLGRALSTSTSGGAFASGELMAIQTTVAWSAAAYTVTLDSSVTMKSMLFMEFSGAQAVLRSTAGTAYSTTTTAASASTTGTTPAVNDLAVGFIFGSNVAAAMAGDNDTSAGSWSTPAGTGTTGGSAATNNFGVFQYKVLTAATAQTLNNSAAMTAGNGAIVAVLQSIPEPAITQAAYQFYDDAGTESGAAALAAQDTATTGNLSAGDGYGVVRVRLQSTTGQAVPATDDFKLQWEKNASGSWNDAISSALVSSYSESNVDTYRALDSSSGNAGVAQSVMGNGQALVRATVYIRRLGTRTGNLTVRVYNHTGTFGSGGKPNTGGASGYVHESTTIQSAASIPTTAVLLSWDFDGTFTLVNGTPYCLSVYSSESSDASNRLELGTDTTTPTASGNAAWFVAGAWTVSPDSDLAHYFYTGSAVASTVIPYNNPNLTEGQATTNRLTGGTGTFVAGKVSEDGTVDDLGWAGNNYTEVLYSVKLLAAQLANGDTLRFRVVRNGSTATMTYSVTPTINITSTAPAVTQAAFRWSTSGTESGSAFDGAQDAPVTALLDFSWNRYLRMRLQSTNANDIPATDDWQLQVAKNGGAWQDVTTSASAPAWAYDTGSLTEGQATTSRLTGGTGTFVAGKVSEDGVADDVGWTANNYTELLFTISLDTTLLNGDVLTFRVLRNGSTTGMTYTQTPTVNVMKTAQIAVPTMYPRIPV